MFSLYFISIFGPVTTIFEFEQKFSQTEVTFYRIDLFLFFFFFGNFLQNGPFKFSLNFLNKYYVRKPIAFYLYYILRERCGKNSLYCVLQTA